MKNKEEIELWKNQQLYIESENGATYSTQIINVDQHELYLQRPLDRNSEPMILSNGMQVSIYFYSDDKEMFEYETILKFINNKLSITKPNLATTRKVQRRNYFRVPASLVICLETQTGETCSFISDDISGGGVAFFTSHHDQLKIGNVVRGCIFLNQKNENKKIPITAKIVNIKTDPNSGFHIAITFVNMRESIRSEIIRYCIKRQYEIRNKLGLKGSY